MANGTEKIIEAIKFYDCGFCTNQLSHMYKGVKSQKVEFHARVLLIKHRRQGYILVDTGYSTRVYENGFLSKLYSTFNPTNVTPDQSIVRQLEKEGIGSDEIKTIVLTHLHPDHIGGVYDFPKSQIVMSVGSEELISRAKLKDLIFKNQISERVKPQIKTIELSDVSPLEAFEGKDLYGDGSLWLLDLAGHAHGQLGVYLPEVNLFYVADAIWGRDFLDYEMRLIPRQVQFDYDQYIHTINKIKGLSGTGIQVISTHGDEDYQNVQ